MMTSDQLKQARRKLGLTQDQLAKVLGLADGRNIRRYEAGSRAISGPVAVAIEMMLAGARPSTWSQHIHSATKDA